MPDEPRNPGAPTDFDAAFDADFDARLDAALSSYSEPRDFDSQATAHRILARVTSQIGPSAETAGAPSKLPWLASWRYLTRENQRRFGIPVGAAALILVVGAILLTEPSWLRQRPPAHNTSNLHRPEANKRPPSGPVETTAEATARNSKPSRRHFASLAATVPRTAPARNAAPRLDVFPNPAPLTPQEQALVSLATNPAASQAALDQQRHAADPIQFSEIRIQPLKIPALDEPQP